MTIGPSGAVHGIIAAMLVRLIRSFRIAPVSAALVSAALLVPSTGPAELLKPAVTRCGVFDIDAVGPQRLADVQGDPRLEWWVEFDSELLVCGAPEVFEAHRGRLVEVFESPISPDRLWLVGGPDAEDRRRSGMMDLLGGGRFAVVAADPGQAEALVSRWSALEGRRRIERVYPNAVVLRQAENLRPPIHQKALESVQDLVDQVNGDRWFADIETLASYNRYTHGSDILNARDWLVTQFGALPGVAVTTPSFNVSGTTAYNVIATMIGSTRPDDWYIVGGHYDSTSGSPYDAAPGAEDNASGCAGVLEMARIFAANPPEATVHFICFSGEEQGLQGAYDHVADLGTSGDLDKVQAMLNMDMIGYTGDADLDCLLETEPWAEELALEFSQAAGLYTTLRVVVALNAWGSDHVPYLDAGIDALLTIENDWAEYPYYHSVNDTPDHLTIAMGLETLKMNVAVMAGKAGAASGLIFSDGFEAGDTSAWLSDSP